jgi:hypothetical protein
MFGFSSPATRRYDQTLESEELVWVAPGSTSLFPGHADLFDYAGIFFKLLTCHGAEVLR